MIAEGYKRQIGEINNSDNSSSSSSKKPCTVVSFRLDEEQYQYLQKIANRMYQKRLIKSSNIGALSKVISLYAGKTYPAIEKQLVKRQKAKRRWINRLLIKDNGDFNF